MTPQEFALCLTAGSALLALWLIVRFPFLTPKTGKAVSAWLGVAIALFIATPFGIIAVGSVVGFLGAAMLIVLPAGTCIFLTVAWIMLFVIRAIQPYQR